MTAKEKDGLLLSVSDVCGLLKISRSCFYEMRKNGELDIPFIRVGKRIRYSKAGLERWVQEQEKICAEEQQAEKERRERVRHHSPYFRRQKQLERMWS